MDPADLRGLPGVLAHRRRTRYPGGVSSDRDTAADRGRWRGTLLAGGWGVTVTLLVVRLAILPWLRLDSGLSDFAAYWGAAAELLQGRSPYGHITYVYPPLLAVILIPLALLPYLAARRVFLALSVAMLLIAAEIVARGRRGFPRLWPFLALAVVGTASENLVLGQAQPLLLLLVTASFVAARRGRPATAGAGLGLAAAVKLWPALLLAAPAGHARRRAVAAGALVLGAGLVLVPLVRVLPGPSAPPATDYAFGTPAVLNGSVAGLAMRTASFPGSGAPPPPSWYQVGGALQTLRLTPAERMLGFGGAVVALVGGLAALAAGGLLPRRSSSPEHDALAWCGLLTVALLVLPVSWYHYQLLQWLTLALAVPLMWRRHRRAAVAATGAILVAGWAAPTVIAAAAHGGDWAGARAGALLAASTVIPVAGIVILAALVVGALAMRSNGGRTAPGDAAPPWDPARPRPSR